MAEPEAEGGATAAQEPRAEDSACTSPTPVDELLAAIAGDDRVLAQLRFAVEIDRLKHVRRRNLLVDASRRENSAEHSWHQAMLAVLLHEHGAPDGDPALDVPRVVQMLLVHDLVEIDAGDTFLYDDDARAGQPARERAAADRLFGLAPADQGSALRQLWEEFEARRTPEARFARALDRLQPLLHNLLTEGQRWREHGVTADRVREINQAVIDGAPRLARVTRSLIDEAVRRGYLDEAPAPEGASHGDGATPPA